MSLLDPFDEIFFRSLIAEMVLTIDAATGDEVSSARIVEAGPAWRIRGRRYSISDRLLELDACASGNQFTGVGFLDVASYYPSIRLGSLLQGLTETGCSSYAVQRLEYFLLGLEKWGLRGLPIGPEASSILGNAYLLPVDSLIRKKSLSFSRFSDDFRFWDVSPAGWVDVLELVDSGLKKLGLSLNAGKTRILTSREEVRAAGNPDLGRIADRLRLGEKDAVDKLHDCFDAEIEKAGPSSPRINFCLAVMRSRKDDHAANRLVDKPEIMNSSPRDWGLYLKEMNSRRKIDREWLSNRALTSAGSDPAVSWNLVGALSSAGSLGKIDGDKFLELAAGTNSSPSSTSTIPAPMRGRAAEAWMRSDSWKPGRAIEVALSVGDLQQRRGVSLTLRRDPHNRSAAKGLTQLGANFDDCRPTVKWLQDGCPEKLN